MANFSRAKAEGQRVKYGITVSGQTKTVNKISQPNEIWPPTPFQSIPPTPTSDVRQKDIKFISTDIRQKKKVFVGDLCQKWLKKFGTQKYTPRYEEEEIGPLPDSRIVYKKGIHFTQFFGKKNTSRYPRTKPLLRFTQTL